VSISGGDLNGDGRFDMVLGNYGGGITLYAQSIFTSTTDLPVDKSPRFKLVPNPTSHQVIVQTPATVENTAVISIFDPLGREVMTQRTHSRNTVLNLDGFSRGIYQVRFAMSGFAGTQKLVIVR
jgi:hypothetical protein